MIRLDTRAGAAALLAALALLAPAAARAQAGADTTAAARHDMAGHDMAHHDMSGMAGMQAPVANRPDTARWTAADVHFMSGMIGHHAQAIQMARMAPTHGASQTVQILAARIINAQQDEIATMQQWLRDRGQPVPAATPMGMQMPGMDHPMLMPGMLTPEQMHELDQARGKDFDRLFLTGMIQHHRGAVAMVQQLFSTYGAAQDETVFKFASDVNVDQTTEIARMQRMLLALLFQTPAP
jgi:uncharacterized protein (DUF305 family)